MARDLVIDSAILHFRVPTGQFEAIFALAPDRAFFHLRDAIGAIYGSHRREWLARTRVSMDSRGLNARKIDSRPTTPGGFAGERSIFYKVFPRSKKRAQGQTLADIFGETYTRSRVALGQELGGVRRPRRARFLAIPIGVTVRADGKAKPRWATPALFRRGKKKKELFVERTSTGSLVLFWKKNKRAPRLAAFRLVPRVVNEKRLLYMDTWETLEADRNRRLRRALARTVADMAKGKR